VETVLRESRQGQMVILYPLIENLYQAYLEHIQNGLIVGIFRHDIQKNAGNEAGANMGILYLSPIRGKLIAMEM
jgi:hypothetical protein